MRHSRALRRDGGRDALLPESASRGKRPDCCLRASDALWREGVSPSRVSLSRNSRAALGALPLLAFPAAQAPSAPSPRSGSFRWRENCEKTFAPHPSVRWFSTAQAPRLWRTKLDYTVVHPVVSTITLSEAKARFSEVVERAVNGEEFVVTRMGRAAVRISRFRKPQATQKARRSSRSDLDCRRLRQLASRPDAVSGHGRRGVRHMLTLALGAHAAGTGPLV